MQMQIEENKWWSNITEQALKEYNKPTFLLLRYSPNELEGSSIWKLLRMYFWTANYINYHNEDHWCFNVIDTICPYAESPYHDIYTCQVYKQRIESDVRITELKSITCAIITLLKRVILETFERKYINNLNNYTNLVIFIEGTGYYIFNWNIVNDTYSTSQTGNIFYSDGMSEEECKQIIINNFNS